MSDSQNNAIDSLFTHGYFYASRTRIAPEHQQPSGPQSVRDVYKERLCVWILRILSGQGHMPMHAEVGNTRLTPIAHLIGVPELADPQASATQVKDAIAAACTAYPDLANTLPAVGPCPMHDTISWLCHSAGLRPIEASIFELAVAFRAFSPLRQVVQAWGAIYASDYPHAVSVLVGYSESDVEEALHPSNALCRSGLVKSRAESYDEGHLYTMLSVSRGLAYRIQHNQGLPYEVMDRLVAAMPAPQLSLQDFPQLAQSWLNSALARSKRQSSAGHMLVSRQTGPG